MWSFSCGIWDLFSGALNVNTFLWTCEWVCFCNLSGIHGSYGRCVSVPAHASVCFVFGLPFGMWNMPAFEVRSLWNENATQCSNTVERDCVYFCLCVCPSVLWVMQSRSEFRFCLWLKTLLCAGCGPHGIQRSFQSCAKFFFSVCLHHPGNECPDFTSPVSFAHLTCLVFHQSVSGWPRLQTGGCLHAAQQQTPVGFLPRGRNRGRDGPRAPRQQRLWDGRQVMSSAPNTFHNIVFTHHVSGPGCTCAWA